LGSLPCSVPRELLPSPSESLVAFRSSPEFYSSGAAAPGYPSRRLPPMRFLPLRRLPVRGQPLSSRGYQPPGSGASSAFRTLSRLSSAHGLPALFHTGPVLGVPALQGLSPPAELSLLSKDLALLRLAYPRSRRFRFVWLCRRSRGTNDYPRPTIRNRPTVSEPHFRALLPASVRTQVLAV
jgi:hypothetical protein